MKSLIQEEFYTLDPNSKRIYRLAALLNSLNLSPITTMVLRSLGLREEWLNFEMAEGKLGGVLKFDPNGGAILPFNRVVSDIISDSAYQSFDETLQDLGKFIDNVTPGDILELGIVHALLLDSLPDRTFGPGIRLKTEEMIKLFGKATNIVKTRPLLLHLGKWQMKEGKLDEAYDTLNEAITTHNKQFDEDATHIYDELGRLELKYAKNAAIEKDSTNAIVHLEKAEGKFIEAKVNPSMTPHPFHGLGLTYIERAKLAETDEERWHFLLLALDQCVYFEEYSGSTYNIDISNLKSQILRLLDHEKLDLEKIERLKGRFGVGNAYAFLSESEESNGNLDAALRLAESGIKIDHTSMWSIRQTVKLLKKKDPSNHQAILSVLNFYVNIMDKRYDVPLSFYLAMELFAVGKIRESQKIFNELSDQSKAHPRRLTPSTENRLYVNGKVKEFVGNVSVVPKFGGVGRIASSELVDWQGGVPVRERDIQFKSKGGETVFFSIIFNMIGPEASQVRFANV